jgi:tol-pal system protein YbgF
MEGRLKEAGGFMRRLTMVLILIALALPLFKAQAKTVDDRVSDLEKRVADIAQTYLTNNADMAKSISSAQSVEQDFAALKGSVEANGHLIESQRQELQHLFRDLEHRVQAIEDRMQIFSSEINKALEKVAPNVAEEGKLYQSGLDKANRSEYLAAAADFQNFIKKYPKSSFTPSAQYWIGECFYSMRDYKRAIKEYQIFIQTYPRNDKVASALLKQGNSFYELGLNDESKPFYDKVIKEHPGSPEASQAAAKIERLSQKKAQGTPGAQAPIQNAPTPSYPAETVEQQRSKYSEPAPSQPPTKQAPSAGQPLTTPKQAPSATQPSTTTKPENKDRRYIEF